MLFKDMTDQGLREAYRGERAAAAGWNGIAEAAPYSRNRRHRSKVAGGVMRALENIDIIVAIARKRGVSLAG